MFATKNTVKHGGVWYKSGTPISNEFGLKYPNLVSGSPEPEVTASVDKIPKPKKHSKRG